MKRILKMEWDTANRVYKHLHTRTQILYMLLGNCFFFFDAAAAAYRRAVGRVTHALQTIEKSVWLHGDSTSAWLSILKCVLAINANYSYENKCQIDIQ